MSSAVSALVKPSRAHRLLLVACGLAACAVAWTLGTGAAGGAAHYLGAPWMALPPALAAMVLLGSAARTPKTHRIDISGTGELRVTVQQTLRRAPHGGSRSGTAPASSGAAQALRVLPGSVAWPLLIVLRWGRPDGRSGVLVMWRDGVDAISWRRLVVALAVIGGRGQGGAGNEKIR